jgi:ketosteroid isomerase-like protein
MTVPDDLLATIHAWDRAMVENDVAKIRGFLRHDWTIVGPDGSLDRQDKLLSLVGAGDLTHDVMESSDLDARVIGDVAIVISRGVSGGAYRGEKFRLVERGTNVFVREDGRWLCVATHLSLIAGENES